MSPLKGSEPRTEMVAVRVPRHLRERIEDYARRFGISFTDSVILALYRGFGDQRGIILPLTRKLFARPDPSAPLPDPFVAALHPKEDN